MSEYMVLRGIFQHRREKVAAGWSRLHTKALHNMHFSPNVVTVMNEGGKHGRDVWHAWDR
jgi:hypothetical protein